MESPLPWGCGTEQQEPPPSAGSSALTPREEAAPAHPLSPYWLVAFGKEVRCRIRRLALSFHSHHLDLREPFPSWPFPWALLS